MPGVKSQNLPKGASMNFKSTYIYYKRKSGYYPLLRNNTATKTTNIISYQWNIGKKKAPALENNAKSKT